MIRLLPWLLCIPPLSGLVTLTLVAVHPISQGQGQGDSSPSADYFLSVAFGAEYSSTASPKIRKWRSDLQIKVMGAPTTEDLRTLNTVVAELNQLTAGEIQVKLNASHPNVTIHFAPEWKFKQLEPNYQPVNYGYFWTQWSGDIIVSANILITSEQVTQQERSHLIREELTQALGLMQDSKRYPDSIFYQPWTDVTEYSDEDRQVIRLLYNPRIKPGMTRSQVLMSGFLEN